MALRVIERDGQPWFVAKDVCDALALTDTTMALQPLDADERSKLNLGQRGLGAVNVVNESGFYALVLKSRKPAAKSFRKWVTSVVLPAIRKDGAYVRGEEHVATGQMTEVARLPHAPLARSLGQRPQRRRAQQA